MSRRGETPFGLRITPGFEDADGGKVEIERVSIGVRPGLPGGLLPLEQVELPGTRGGAVGTGIGPLGGEPG
jgi:hypothetical protein